VHRLTGILLGESAALDGRARVAALMPEVDLGTDDQQARSRIKRGLALGRLPR